LPPVFGDIYRTIVKTTTSVLPLNVQLGLFDCSTASDNRFPQ
jgi:hypothetical protein